MRQLRAHEHSRLQQTHQLDVYIRKHIAHFDAQLQAIDKEIAPCFESSQTLDKNRQLLLSIPGVGPTVSATLLVFVPHLGSGESKSIGSYVGVVPFVRQSGTWSGAAHIMGGQARAREALFWSVRSALVHNPVLKAFYARLRGNGKSFRQAAVAVMHKLLRIAHALTGDQVEFDKEVHNLHQTNIVSK